MADNMIQKIREGKYSQVELEDIIDAVIYAKQTYKIVNANIDKAEQDIIKKQKLEKIEQNIKDIKVQIKKNDKKQVKCVIGLTAFAVPLMIALAFVSAFNSALLGTTAAISLATVGVGSIPIGVLDRKRKIMLAEIAAQEQERVQILSDVCFSVTPEYAKNAYNDYKKSHSEVVHNNNTNDDSLSI